MFITLYGINNIGKSTQAKKLVENLKKLGHKAIYLKYPIYDLRPTGPFLNKTLRSHSQSITEEELQTWFTLNRFQFEPKLKSYLDKGYIVVAEDYVGTALAWGSVKGASLTWLENLNKYLLKEDLAILIKGDRSTKSIEDGHIHENDHKLVTKVQKALILIGKTKGWKTIKRQEKPAQTAKMILDIVKKELSC